MKHLFSSTWPALVFVFSTGLLYLLYGALWTFFLFQKVRKKPALYLLKKPFSIILHILAGIGILCFLYGYFIEPYWIDIQYIDIKTDKLDHTSFRVVQISDTHCDPKIRLESRLPEIISALNPDIIVFTGDTINHPIALKNFQEMMYKMNAPLGKFAVQGNWDVDYWNNLDLFKDTGFEELVLNQKRILKEDESIVLSGLRFDNGKISFRVVGKLDENDFNLFLYHNTDLIDYFDTIPIDLYLCGHTHGGQIALPFYGALTTLSRHGKKFESGLYKSGSIYLYVNRGIGMEGGRSPRIRFCARPEITVFDISPNKSLAEVPADDSN